MRNFQNSISRTAILTHFKSALKATGLRPNSVLTWSTSLHPPEPYKYHDSTVIREIEIRNNASKLSCWASCGIVFSGSLQTKNVYFFYFEDLFSALVKWTLWFDVLFDDDARGEAHDRQRRSCTHHISVVSSTSLRAMSCVLHAGTMKKDFHTCFKKYPSKHLTQDFARSLR